MAEPFHITILDTSKQSGVPPRLLKNIFAWESQFWPQSTYVNTYEYGLGHITEMAPTPPCVGTYPSTMQFVPPVFSDTCKTDYADQPTIFGAP